MRKSWRKREQRTLYRSKMQSPAYQYRWINHESPIMTARYLKNRMVKMVQKRAAETHLPWSMNARLHAELDINSSSRGQTSWYTIGGTLHIPLNKRLSLSYIARQILAEGARPLAWRNLCSRLGRPSLGSPLRWRTTRSRKRFQMMRMNRAKPHKIRRWRPAATSRTHQMSVLSQATPKVDKEAP